MKRISVPARCTQHGFTLVEVVAVMVITVTLAAWAMPRMGGPSEYAVRTAADRLVAALHYAQVLAQRQGLKTKVEIKNEVIAGENRYVLRVTQNGSLVSMLHEHMHPQSVDPEDPNNDKYKIIFHSGVSIIASSAPCGTVSYNDIGIPTTITSECVYEIRENGETRVKLKLEPTGHAFLVPIA